MNKKSVAYLTYEFWRERRRTLQNQILTYGRPTEPKDMYKDRYAAARQEGKRSGFEVRVAKELDALKIPYEYEEHTIAYEQPEKSRRYTPDFIFPNGVVVELKGRWITADRAKMTLVRAQHPDIDIRMVFENPNARISPRSKTTYAMVCKKLGIPCAKQHIPVEWIYEPVNKVSLLALEAANYANL